MIGTGNPKSALEPEVAGVASINRFGLEAPLPPHPLPTSSFPSLPPHSPPYLLISLPTAPSSTPTTHQLPALLLPPPPILTAYTPHTPHTPTLTPPPHTPPILPIPQPALYPPPLLLFPTRRWPVLQSRQPRTSLFLQLRVAGGGFFLAGAALGAGCADTGWGR